MNPVYTLDISRHQDAFDAAAAKRAGAGLCLLRACYSIARDARFYTFASACRAAALPMGAYLFTTAHYESRCCGKLENARRLMNAELTLLLDTLQGQGVTGWVALDQELESGQKMGLTRSENTALLNEACARLAGAGYHPCVYASAAWLKARVNAGKLTAPVWAAWYFNDPADPDFADCPSPAEAGGKWGRYLTELQAQGKLAGWQFGRIGCGAKYGAGSANIDRSLFYSLPQQPAPACPQAYETFIAGLYEAVGLAAPQTPNLPDLLQKLPALSRLRNREHPAVRCVQTYLNALGYPCGAADGIAGILFERAVKQYQREHGCTADGILSPRQRTWQCLIGLL